MIISLSSLKGGSGKTTLAVHLAHAIALSNTRVLLADADPQASAQGWAAAREEKPPFPVIGMARNTLHRDLPEVLANYDHCVIDTPPRVSALARTAILAADLVLIPVQPSSYDVWAASETVQLVEEAKGFKPDLQAAFVINRRIVNTPGRPKKGEQGKRLRPALEIIVGKSLKTIQRYLKEPEPEKTWTSAQVLKEREIRKAINALNKWKEMEPTQKREKELLEQLPDILTALSRVIDQDK